MPVYNGERYIREAIESILTQTLEDFELLIIDNGSTDHSLSISQSYLDPRIRLLTEWERGLVPPLNRGLREARGTYIARMDADDISAPQRLARQVAHMRMHPQTILLGSWAPIIDAEGRTTGHCHTPPTEGIELYAALCAENRIVHGSVMMRRDVALSVGGYSYSFMYAEDYDLWFRLAELGPIANIAEPLYYWRSNPQSTMHSALSTEKEACAMRARRNALERYISRRKHPISREQNFHESCQHARMADRCLFDAVSFNEWAQPYLVQSQLGMGVYLLLRALLSQPLDARVWTSIRQIYTGRTFWLLHSAMTTVRTLLRTKR